jgi:hypothetical protein
MGKAARDRAARAPEAPEAPREATWSDVRALSGPAVVTARDRLHLFAGEGEEGFTAPESVRKDPDLLLAWCERYEPESVLVDATALIKATNRQHGELMARLREFGLSRYRCR